MYRTVVFSIMFTSFISQRLVCALVTPLPSVITSTIHKVPFLNMGIKRWQNPAVHNRLLSHAKGGFKLRMVEKCDEKTLESMWNIPELKKETSRLTLRCHKKISKASERLSNANKTVEELRTDPNATLEQLEACPDLKSIENELDDLKQRLGKLMHLEEKLKSVKSGNSVVLPVEIASIVLELGVNDSPPKQQERGTKKAKGPKTVEPRKPYFSYYSENNTEIRVGRRSEDNDELSCNPEHGDGPDWWMHAAGCPGSHVVIRCHDDELDREVIKDAAALAARQSKCQGNIIKVNLTRWRDVKKPPGAKPGLVQLVGKVQTISVNMKEAQSRLERLDGTKNKRE